VAVVGAFWSPAGSRQRLEALRVHAEHLRVQGLQLHLGTDQDLDLPGVRVHRLAWESVLWQKEAILNLLIERLPPVVEYVIWADTDILWTDYRLGFLVREALQSHRVVQCWSRCTSLRDDCQVLPVGHAGIFSSMALHNATHEPISVDARDSHCGFAWAARRNVLQRIGGLYDASVFGSGDVWIAEGCWGQHGPAFDEMSHPMQRHIEEWCHRAYRVIGGNVGFVDVHCLHLYHGQWKRRHYVERRKIVREYDFDPERHIVKRNGLWEWTDDAPAGLVDWMHEYLTVLRGEA